MVVAANGTMIDTARATPAITATRSVPQRLMATPLICIPANDPIPRMSSTVPVTALDIPTLCLSAGRCTAHVDNTMPKEANNANTAARA